MCKKNCIYHASLLLKDGKNPEYGHYCKHPKAISEITLLCGPGVFIGRSGSELEVPDTPHFSYCDD